MWNYPAMSTAADALFDSGMEWSSSNYNYRTGSFGWLAHPELSAEFEKVASLSSFRNWGMLNQFVALEWIHANIDALGGDPSRITVMDQ